QSLSISAHTPNAAEVERLKREVEALRSQLASMQTQPTTEPAASVAQANESPATSNEPTAEPANAPWTKHPRMQVARAGESGEAVPKPSAAASRAVALGSAGGNRLAAQPEEEQFVEENLLPAPALDFSKADKSTGAAARYSPVTARAGKSPPIRSILLGLGLVGAVGCALWFGVPGLGTKSKNSSGAPAPNTQTPSAGIRVSSDSAAARKAKTPAASTSASISPDVSNST